MNRPLHPTSPLGWASFRLSFVTVVWGRLFLLLPALLGLRLQGGPVRIPLGLVGAVIEIGIALAALAVGSLRLGKASGRGWCSSRSGRQFSSVGSGSSLGWAQCCGRTRGGFENAVSLALPCT